MMEEMFPGRHSQKLKIPIDYEDGSQIYIIGKVDLYEDKGIEIKTCRFLPEAPRREHIRQAQIYMYGFKEKEWWISYFEKNSEHPLKYERNFKVEFSQRTITNIIKKTKLLHSYLLKNEVPPNCSNIYCDICGVV